MEQKSMWRMLRENYTNYTQSDIARMSKRKRQAIYIFETGYRPMPKDLQILYLGFRNNEQDKINIKFLKDLLKEREEKGDGKYID